MIRIVQYVCQQGFFLGDGAGMGKGRQIAGIIYEAFIRARQQGRADLRKRSSSKGLSR